MISKKNTATSFTTQSGAIITGSSPFPQANATGRSAKTVREYLEKHYSPEAVSSRDDTILLAIRALLEVVQSSSKNMELAVMEKGKPLEVGPALRDTLCAGKAEGAVPSIFFHYFTHPVVIDDLQGCLKPT